MNNNDFEETEEIEKVDGNKTNETSVVKRFLISAGSGLVFGIFAAIAFFAVKEIGTAIGNNSATDNKVTVSTEIQNSEEEKADSVSYSGDKEANVTTLHTSNGTSIVTDVTTVVEQKMPTIVAIKNNYVANTFYFSQEVQASGSGIIIGSNEDELLIATNYHVIENNNSLEVVFCDESSCEAQVKGTDQDMDLAVIAVKMDDISKSTMDAIDYAIIGDSDALKVGEPVIAIGNSLGYGQSVTAGVVSAVNRSIKDSESKFIQTDAAINFGNSGGALLNLAGELVGINSNKIGGNAVEGMGYAIPISAAKPIIEELMQKETKQAVAVDKQGYLGISGATITSAEAEFYGYPEGVYVAEVFSDSAAKRAGIKKGDFITSMNGEKISSMEQLKKQLTYYEGGTEVEIGIKRDAVTEYKDITVTVKLGFKNEADEG